MQLPEITEDEPAAVQELVELVKERYTGGVEGRFNFQLGEISTLKMVSLSEGAVSELHKLLSHLVAMRAENGYCYYKVKSLLGCSQEEVVPAISL
jgi:glycine cleavage system regulatory protein